MRFFIAVYALIWISECKKFMKELRSDRNFELDEIQYWRNIELSHRFKWRCKHAHLHAISKLFERRDEWSMRENEIVMK
jgi:ABC-type nickel/cobalt efflux system permease component RcnA